MVELSETKDKEKDPVDFLVILGGVIVGILIIYGFITSLIPFVYPPQLRTGTSTTAVLGTPSTACKHCITSADSNTRITVKNSEDITIELPAAKYPKQNLLLFGNPEGTLELGEDAHTRGVGDWAVTVHALQKGAGDIIVQSNDPTVSDFHVSFIIQ